MPPTDRTPPQPLQPPGATPGRVESIAVSPTPTADEVAAIVAALTASPISPHDPPPPDHTVPPWTMAGRRAAHRRRRAPNPRDRGWTGGPE